jgi:hypothetical protein
MWKLPYRHYQHEMFRFVPRYVVSLTCWVPLKDNKDVNDKLRKLLKEAIKTSFRKEAALHLTDKPLKFTFADAVIRRVYRCTSY